jgi:phosphate transport system substrate-binding protein
VAVLLSGCARPPAQPPATEQPPPPPQSTLTGTISADGSSTVGPLTQAVAEDFNKVHPGVKVTVGISGTGGGFKKFTAGETDLSNASRPIKDKEQAAAAEHKVEYIELPVAFDGLAVVVSKENAWVDKLTINELKTMWSPEKAAAIKTWADVRPGWPKEPLKLFGPGTDSGTFEYFTEAVVGKAKASRSDYTASEDDNVLVQGVAGDKSALGYFGLAYYEENKDNLKLVPIDAGDGKPVAPSTETVENGTYKPLSRPLFVYVSKTAAARPEVKAFVEFYLDQAAEAAKKVGYVGLPSAAYAAVRQRFVAGTTGSVFAGKKTVGLKIEDILAAEK